VVDEITELLPLGIGGTVSRHPLRKRGDDMSQIKHRSMMRRKPTAALISRKKKGKMGRKARRTNRQAFLEEAKLIRGLLLDIRYSVDLLSRKVDSFRDEISKPGALREISDAEFGDDGISGWSPTN
jgi:hypothetical protein